MDRHRSHGKPIRNVYGEEMKVPDEHRHYAELHGMAIDLFDEATTGKKVNLRLLLEAFKLEFEVAKAVLRLNVNDLTIFLYNSSAALMARMLSKPNLSIDILLTARQHISSTNLRAKIDGLFLEEHGLQVTEYHGKPVLTVVNRASSFQISTLKRKKKRSRKVTIIAGVHPFHIIGGSIPKYTVTLGSNALGIGERSQLGSLNEFLSFDPPKRRKLHEQG